MKFAPEYVTNVLNENFEDAKELLLSPLMAINYAHLVMLAEQGIISAPDARALRDALDGISLDRVRDVLYDGTYEDLFFYIERLIDNACGDDVAGRLHTARSRNDIDMTMYRMRQREFIAALARRRWTCATRCIDLAERHTETVYGAHTHTQPAQPTTIAHYLLAVIEQLERDTTRLAPPTSRPIAIRSAPARSPAPASRSIATAPASCWDSAGRPATPTAASPRSITCSRARRRRAC